MTGKKAIMEQLIAQQVKYIFGNPGSTEEGFIIELADYPQLQYVLALHEGVAVGMADAYAQVTGKPSVVQLHAAPGLGNAINMLYNSKVTNVSIVVIAGHNHSKVLFQEPNLSGPLIEMAKPVTKWAYQVSNAQDVPQALRRAFKIAAEPPKGPVFLAFTLDALEEEADMKIAPATFVYNKAKPEATAIANAGGLLLQANAPCIFMGDGVGYGDAQKEITKVAELLGAPMLELTGNTQVNAPAMHPLKMPSIFYVFPKDIKTVLHDCDVLLMVGARQFPITFPEPDKTLQQSLLTENCKVIQIDANSWELGKNINAALLICADPKAALSELAVVLKEQQTNDFKKLAEERKAKISLNKKMMHEAFNQSLQNDWDKVPISPMRLIHELKLLAPSNTLFFTEALSNEQIIEKIILPETTTQSLRGTAGPGLGIGLPGTIGAQLAAPDKKVIGIVSDGAAIYSITALWTAAHLKLPVTYIILNNAAYQVLKNSTIEYYGKEEMKEKNFIGMDLFPPGISFMQLAEAMGVKGFCVAQPDKLKNVLEEAINFKGPSLVEVIIQTKTDN